MFEHKHEEALKVFKKAIDNISPIPEGDFEQFAHVMHYRKYKKGDVLLREGKICRHFWFILQGCLRIYSLETGMEVNIRFFTEQNIATDFISLRHSIPTHFYIVALEDTEVLYSYKPDYKPLLSLSKPLINLTAEFFAHNLFDEIEHSNSFKLMSPEERYINLMITRPKYFQRIPLTYLASYLGMSRKTLSRIRSNAN
jgi:CRP-like cAMP-binding protein